MTFSIYDMLAQIYEINVKVYLLYQRFEIRIAITVFRIQYFYQTIVWKKYC